MAFTKSKIKTIVNKSFVVAHCNQFPRFRTPFPLFANKCKKIYFKSLGWVKFQRIVHLLLSPHLHIMSCILFLLFVSIMFIMSWSKETSCTSSKHSSCILPTWMVSYCFKNHFVDIQLIPSWHSNFNQVPVFTRSTFERFILHQLK